MAAVNLLLVFSGRIVGVAILLYLADDVGFDPGALGMIFAVGGVTSLAGTAVAGRPELFGGLGRALTLSLAIRAVGGLFLPLTDAVSPLGYGLLVMSQVVTDPAWVFWEINLVSVRQAITPDRLLGRVNATVRTFEFGAMLLGTAAAGLLGETVGLRAALFGCFALSAFAPLLLALSPVRQLREMPALAPELPVAEEPRALSSAQA